MTQRSRVTPSKVIASLKGICSEHYSGII